MPDTGLETALRKHRPVPEYPMMALFAGVLLFAGLALLIWGVATGFNFLLIALGLILLSMSCLLDAMRDLAINSWHQRRLLEEMERRDRPPEV